MRGFNIFHSFFILVFLPKTVLYNTENATCPSYARGIHIVWRVGLPQDQSTFLFLSIDVRTSSCDFRDMCFSMQLYYRQYERFSLLTLLQLLNKFDTGLVTLLHTNKQAIFFLMVPICRYKMTSSLGLLVYFTENLLR